MAVGLRLAVGILQLPPRLEHGLQRRSQSGTDQATCKATSYRIQTVVEASGSVWHGRPLNS
jgi:hypothetical protein